MPESSRPSLRALASELHTSHQLLAFYLKHLEKWRGEKWLHEASEIRTRSYADSRPMSPWEEQRVNDLTRAGVHAITGSMLHGLLERLERDAKCGPLHPAQFKIVKMLSKQGFPGAQDLLQKCSQVGVKERKRFAEIVKETPRQEGEEYGAWVRRIWDECDKYDTNCPTVITEQLLERCSQSRAKNPENNLPPISGVAAKSFRTGQGKAQ